MYNGPHSSMAEATRLTREGRLGEATAMIQLLLSGNSATLAGGASDGGGAIIELTSQPRDALRLDFAKSPRSEARPTMSPRAATFRERSYRTSSGTLAYWLYTPAGETRGRPLVVMLHGCTQSAEDFARGTRMNRLADELGLIVAYPQQSRSANPQGCWNWFKPGDQRRDLGEPALIAGATREIIRELALNPRKVFVAGLSAGGAAAAIMAETYPDIYAAVGIHSGIACGSARDLPSALMAMNGRGTPVRSESGTFVRVITFHGDCDNTVNEINSQHIVAAATAVAGASLRTESHESQDVGGRSCTRTVSYDPSGRPLIEQWTVHGAGHAWAGGDRSGSYTDTRGPDASREMLRFFLAG